MAEHDYIVVGSGAGGGPLAARLAELGHRVLLLEAGGDDAPSTYQVPVFHGLATEDPLMRLDHYVRHYADDDRQNRDPKYEDARGGVFYPRARTLGGCTAHYAMIIIRPHDSDWEAIRAATGDDSWAPERMNQYFARVERCDYRAGGAGGHGTDGWLPTRFPDVVDLGTEAIKHQDRVIGEIAANAAVHPLPPRLPIGRTNLGTLLDVDTAFDPNDLRVLDKDSTGLIAVPMAIDQHGRRAGTRERIRDAAANATKGPGKLDVQLHTHVTGLVYDKKDPLRVVGVRYKSGERLYRADREPSSFGTPPLTEQEARANREVILSAGAYITPQLLMLSGIGPKETLEAHGIPLVVDLPGVGANLQDRYEVGIVAKTKSGEPFPLLSDATFKPPAEGEPGDPLFQRWRDHGKGLYATNGAVVGFTMKSSVAEEGEPDLFIFGVPGSFVGYYTHWAEKAVAKPYDKWTWLLLKAHARFRGRVTLKSSDPFEPPLVDFNYFARDANGAPTDHSAKDLTAMREGVDLVRRMIEESGVLTLDQRAMAQPGPTTTRVDLQSRTGIDDFVQDRAWGHHASCTCKIGGDDDPDAVLDSKFRVRGVKGLRVVDASVFPKIPGFFVVMPTYMISEKAAEVIDADARSSAPPGAGVTP